MGRTWVLETGTKGTGANVVPLEKVEKQAGSDGARPAARPRARGVSGTPRDGRPSRRPAARPGSKTSSPLPPGHVRKKATGEIGKIRSVDAKAGTATVYWLKRGAASTVPLRAVSRR